MAKPPIHSARELEAMENADRVILRTFRDGEWREEVLQAPSEYGATVKEILKNVKVALSWVDQGGKVSIYVGGMVRGSLHLASIDRRQIL